MGTRFIAILILFVSTSVTFAQTPTPTASPLIPHDETNAQLNDVVTNINALPDNIQTAARIGIDPNVVILFGYVKWLLSTNTAYELLGETLAPVGVTVIVMMNVVLVLTGIWLIVNMIVFTIKFIVWIYNVIMKIAEVISNVIGAFL